MCGRYALGPYHPARDIEREYFASLDEFPGRYNVAPTQEMPIVRMHEGKPELVSARWGLIPSWANDMKVGFSTINARAETVATKPAFRDAYKWRRCLVAATGYYEWQKRPDGKQPYYFTSRDGSLLVFAGLWESWKPKEGDPVLSYTIIVCEPNPLASAVHDRMPVIIPDKDWRRWLVEPDVRHLLKPCPEDTLESYPVSRAVNSSRNESPQLIEPVSSCLSTPARQQMPR